MLPLFMCKTCSIDDGGQEQPARSYSAYGCLVVISGGTLSSPPCHNSTIPAVQTCVTDAADGHQSLSAG